MCISAFVIYTPVLCHHLLSWSNPSLRIVANSCTLFQDITILSGHQHLRVFNDEDYNKIIATTIRHFRHFYGLYSPCEDIIKVLSCD